MAIRIDTSGGDYLSRTSPFSHNAAYTWMAWIRLETDINNYGHFFHVGGAFAYDANTDSVGHDTDGVTLRTGCAGGGTNSFTTGSGLSVGTWYHVALVRASTASLATYLDGVSNITNTDNVSGRAAVANAFIGSYNSLPMDGRIAHPKMWDTNLSPAEIAAEMLSYTPVKTANLWAYLPCNTGGGAQGDDASGNGRHFTINGTITIEDDPVLPTPPALGGYFKQGLENNLRPRQFAPGLAR